MSEHFKDYLLRFISATTDCCDFDHFVAAPYLRRKVSCDEKPVQVTLKVCGLGFYKLYVNGSERTRGLLAPYITNPDEILYFDTYDLTENFAEGDNVLAFQLGNGMQNAFGAEVWDFQLARFRSAPKLAMELVLVYAEGRTETIWADEQFQTAPSPIQMDDLRSGERYDARKEIPGWNLPGFDDSAWKSAIPAETPRGVLRENHADPVVISRTLKPASFGPGIMSHDDSPRQDVASREAPADEQGHEGYLYDFGENVSAIFKLKIRGSYAGQKVILQFAERKTDGGLDLSTMPFLPKGFDHRAVYICRGDEEEVYEPSFTYFGCQYCLVMGVSAEQAAEDLLTLEVVHTDLKPLASFTCSDPVVNKIQEAVIRSNLSNFIHFPTDCPHREKNGWTGDAAMSAEQLLMNHSAEQNLSQWLLSICAAQNKEGAIPGIVPTGGWGFDWGNGPAWDEAMFNIPYMLWQERGDLRPANAAASSMLRYLHYLYSQRDDQGLVHFGLGDWLPVTVIRAPLELTDTVIAVEICRKSAEMFDALGLDMEADYAYEMMERFRDAAREHLIDFSTMTARGSSQTSQAMMIYSNIFDDAEKPAAFARLVQIIEEDHNQFDCGMLGTRVLFHVLSEFGRTDLAYHLITNPEAPSYGRMIAYGSNSLWEKFAMEPENSMNHHFFGDISSWFMKNLAGLKQNPHKVNPDECLIQPRFIDEITSVQASRTLPCGELKCSYEKDGDHVIYQLIVPEGSTGAFVLEPGWRFDDGTAYKPAVSGTYQIHKV